MITKVLSENRLVIVFTSEHRPQQSGLKFEFHGMTSFIPLRTSELVKIRDMITEQIKSNGD